MKKVCLTVFVTCLMISLMGCAARHQKKVEQEMKQPINCETAEGDIRVLKHEKAHVTDQIAAGVTSIAPPAFVLGVVTGTEKTKVKVATGEYNKMIDKHIAEIKQKCGIE